MSSAMLPQVCYRQAHTPHKPLSYLHIERDIMDAACSIVKVHCEVIKADPLLQELTQVVLEEVATGSLL